MSDQQSERGSVDGSIDDGGDEAALDRRSYLKLGVGAAAASVGSSTLAARAGAASETRHGISFGTVLNAVDDLGMDPNGNQPIDDELDDAAASDTLIEFPPGEYLVTEEHVFLRLNNFGMRGTGGDRTDTQFVFPSGFDDRVLVVRFGRNHLFENFSLQQTNDRATGAGVVFACDDGLHVEDFEILGYNGRNKMRGMSAKIYDEGGEGVIKRYVRKGNSAVGDYPSGTQALLMDPEHRGTMYLRDLHIENAGENGVYASRTPGNVRVEGGFFKNNDVASIRICGEGSYVKDATFVVDTDGSGNDGSFDNARGLWVESKTKGYSGGYAENCEFVMRSADNSGGLLRVDGTAGSFDVRNCRFHNETRFATLFFRESGVSGPKKVSVTNTSITCDSNDQRREALEIEGRSGSVIEDCCIATTGSGFDGIVLHDSNGNAIRRTTVNTSGEPIVFDNASAQTSGISYSGSCPLPNESGGGSQDGGGSGGSDDSGSDDSGSDDAGSDGSDGSDGSNGSDDSDDSGSGDSGGSDGESTLHVEGTGQFASYEFSVSGAVRQDPETQLAGPDTVGESSGSGAVAGGTDGYLVTGTIESFEFTQGSARVVLDGEQVDPDSLGGTETGGRSSDTSRGGSDESPEDDADESSGEEASGSAGSSSGASDGSQVTLHVVGRDDLARYELRASSIEQDPETELAGPDTISGSSASGAVAGGTDGYLVTGLESFEFTSGAADVYLDGQQVDPADVGGAAGSSTGGSSDDASSEDEESSTESTDSDTGGSSSAGSDEAATLHVVGTDQFASYEFSVSGTVQQDPETELAGPDTVGESSASGAVEGGTDGYLVTGTIESFEFTQGSAEVYLNDQQVDPASLGGTEVASARGRARTLAVGRTDATARSYSLQVSNAVEGVDAGDATVDGTTVTGVLDREADVIRFSGSLDGFELDGADGARVALDGTDVSPDAL